MARTSAVFRIGDEVAPPGLGAYPEEMRRAFWRFVVQAVKEEKDHELALGLDRSGRPLAAIARKTRKYRRSAMGRAYKTAPPLSPAYGLSRTRAWLKGRAYTDHAEFYWSGGWGRILTIHRAGTRHLPVRDVIGLSPASIGLVRQRAWAWWRRETAPGGSRRPLAVPGILHPAHRVPPAPHVVAARPTPAPARIPVIGRTDFENATFAGSGSGPGSGIERARASLAAGLHSGFFRFGEKR